MTISHPYYAGATQMPGPPTFMEPQENTVEGVIFHSAEGDWSDAYEPTDTMTSRGVSWQFTIFKDGRVQQHYSLNASCWPAGSPPLNRRLVGVECEGKNGEPLTEAQIREGRNLLAWMKERAGWTGLTRGVTLFEHHEVNPATTCPNGRIPWARYTGPEAVEARDLGQIAADLTYGVQTGRVSLVEHGPSPARSGWTRLVVDYLPP